MCVLLLEQKTKITPLGVYLVESTIFIVFSSIRNKLSVVSCNLIRLSSFVAMLCLFDFSQVIWSHPHAFCGMDLWIDISIKTISVGCHFWEWDMIRKVNYIMTGCHFDMYIVCLSTCKCAQSVHGDLIDWLSLNGEWFYNVLRSSTVVIQGGDWLINWLIGIGDLKLLIDMDIYCYQDIRDLTFWRSIAIQSI